MCPNDYNISGLNNKPEMRFEMAIHAIERLSLERILSSTQDGVFVIDDNQRFIFLNPACERLTGFSAEELIECGRSCGDLLECRDIQGRLLAGGLCPARIIADGKQASAKQLMQIRTKTGQQRWVETQYTAFQAENDQHVCVIGVIRDATEAHEKEELWRQSIERLREEVGSLRDQLQKRYGFAGIVTRSPAMQTVFEKIRSACGSSSPVLISGESGTGKELVARTIHFNGLQKNGPFITLSVAATPKQMVETELFGVNRGAGGTAVVQEQGMIRSADGGTLLIEGVEGLSDSCQARLLKTIQDRAVRPIGSAESVKVNVRIIASAKRPLTELIAEGSIRDDLLSRLSVISIEMPPLRARKEDIPLLVEEFIRQLNAQSTRQVHTVEADLWHTLDEYKWPGNVRELHNVIEAAFAAGTGDTLRHTDINVVNASRKVRPEAEEISDMASLDNAIADFERQAIYAALRRTNGQRSLAAKLLGISRSRLYRRMDALGIGSKSETR